MKKAKFAVIAAAVAILTAVPAYAWDMPEELIPVGEVCGISMGGDGVVITELGERGGVSPARDAGLRPGDRIVELGGVAIDGPAALLEAVSGSGDKLTAVYVRDGREYETVIEPLRDDNGAYIGVWVRSGISGIGTLTFYDSASGVFGALGHPVSEDGTGAEGYLKTAELHGITKGKSGDPGELTGSVGDETLGTITVNSGVGIFGCAELAACGEPIPVAKDGEIRAGECVIIASPDGVRREYSAEIVRVYTDSDSARSMMIRITDPALIELTGGIVQGMSGSPILQDGKLVGAVTHVLVSDSARGYAVSISRMLEECAERGLYDKAA